MGPLPHLLTKNVPGKIFFPEALLDNHKRAGLGVVETSRQRAVPPLDGGGDGGFRVCFLRRIGVIDDNNIPAFTRKRRPDRCRES